MSPIIMSANLLTLSIMLRQWAFLALADLEANRADLQQSSCLRSELTVKGGQGARPLLREKGNNCRRVAFRKIFQQAC
jgi:hypothetical protein